MKMATNTAANSISIFSLLDALRRRKLIIIIPTIVLTAGVAVFAHYQPDKYRATAVIAAAQTAPPDYLRHVAPPPVNIEDHLWTVREVLFSDLVLQEAAKVSKAYGGAQADLSPQQLEEFKKHITIKVDSEHAFQVIYDTGDPHDAMNVTNRLAELFVAKASAKREQNTTEAASVIDNQLDSLKKHLDDESRRIHDYRTQAVQALPDHIDDNIRLVDETRTQIQVKETKIAEELAKKASIEKEIQDLESKGVLDQPLVHEKTSDEQKLEDLRLKLAEAQTKYTAQHPIVVALKRQVLDMEKTIQSQPRKGRSEPSATYLRYSQLKSELEGVEQRAAAYRREEEGLK